MPYRFRVFRNLKKCPDWLKIPGAAHPEFSVDKMCEKFNIQRFEDFGPLPERKRGF
jgi:hypothetical protein